MDSSRRNEKNIRGKPKITLVEVVEKDMPNNKVTKSMSSDRRERQRRIHVAQPLLSC
jgi:hypothetical protein